MTVTITGPAKANLRKFLEAAANSGMQFADVDASYLVVELFENDTKKGPGPEATAVTVTWPNGYMDLMWADELDPDRDEMRGGEPTVTYLVPRGAPPTASEALLAVLDRFETVERGLPQAHIAARLAAELRVAITRAESGWRPMSGAPKDGTPVLLRFKKKLDLPRLEQWQDRVFVGRNHGDVLLWGFAAPVGAGGFPDEWLIGWQPIPADGAPA